MLGAYDTSSVSLRLPPSPTGEGLGGREANKGILSQKSFRAEADFSVSARFLFSLPPGGRWILYRKRRKENAKVRIISFFTATKIRLHAGSFRHGIRRATFLPEEGLGRREHTGCSPTKGGEVRRKFISPPRGFGYRPWGRCPSFRQRCARNRAHHQSPRGARRFSR